MPAIGKEIGCNSATPDRTFQVHEVVERYESIATNIDSAADTLLTRLGIFTMSSYDDQVEVERTKLTHEIVPFAAHLQMLNDRLSESLNKLSWLIENLEV